MRQALNTTVAMINLLDQMKQNNDAGLCQPLLASYRSLHDAPVYEANGKNYEWQQAYDAYRQAIGLADSRADIFESCGQSGSTLGPVNWGAARKSLTKAQFLLEQGIEWTKRATGLPANASLVEAVTRVRLSTASLLKALEDLLHDDQACGPFITEYNILLQAPTYDVSTQPTNVQGAYSLYRRAIEMTLDKTKFVVEVCNTGGEKLHNLNHQIAIETSREAVGYLDQALVTLQQ